MAGCAAGAPSRSGIGEEPGAPAYAHSRHVPMRQLRLSRTPALLALPRVRRVGNVFAAPQRGKSASPMSGPRVIAALDAIAGGTQRPQLIAVTLLTSMAANDMKEIGLAGDPASTSLRLARLAQASGLDGVVCSAQEAQLLKRECGKGFRLVTPGIR